ncbi:hypothetical protein C0Q70_01048 [Pomacea canaliculata]|uniref:Uncharacterized protein n=1 Tax=Pomacea canaliculata TaxID=400727 RepID=A0A2T7PYE0_POMCA|nr:hypothetical protein C0Q70_01048 [Pomacea canaliculata]
MTRWQAAERIRLIVPLAVDGIALVSTAPKACTVMDTNSDISEPYQTIVIVEDNIDSSSVDANVIPANRQEPDSDRSAPSTLTSVHVNWPSPSSTA